MERQFDLIYLDMDGVLCNFEFGVTCLFNLSSEPLVRKGRPESLLELYPNDLTQEKLVDAVNNKGPAFWKQLVRFAWANDLVTLCDKHCHELWFLTSPWEFAPAIVQSGKEKWLDRWGYRTNRLYVTNRKDVYARKRILLIDDNEENCKAFEKAGGQAILFPSYGNGLLAETEDAVELLSIIEGLIVYKKGLINSGT